MFEFPTGDKGAKLRALHKRIRKRAVNVGLSRRQAWLLAELVTSQLSGQGYEHGVKYLKKVRDSALNSLYGTPANPSWVAKKFGFPKRLNFLRDVPRDVLFYSLNSFNVAESDCLLGSQVKKRLGSVVTPLHQSFKTNVDEMCVFLKDAVSQQRKLHLNGCDSSSVLLLKQREVDQEGKTFLPFGQILSVYRNHPILLQDPELEEYIFPMTLELFFELVELNPSDTDRTMGKVRFAQEPALKARLYAAPHIPFQVHTQRLHDVLDTYRSHLETDCTYDQEAGALWAQSFISEGRPIYSVDISSATDRFPFSVQIAVLESLGIEPYLVRLFEYITQSGWTLEIPSFPIPESSAVDLISEFCPDNVVTWAVGQPLGLKPSMSAFSLTHNYLLMALCDQLGLTYSESFRVLGDDVVISSKALRDLYIASLSSIGVEVSLDKCRNGLLAEFAGYQVDKNNCIRPTKWRKCGIHNCVELAREYRSLMSKEISTGLQKVLSLFCFRDGFYNPPVDKWSSYLRLNYEFLSKSLRELFEPLYKTKATIKSGRRTIDPLDVRRATFHDGAVEFVSSFSQELSVSRLTFKGRRTTPLCAIGPVIDLARKTEAFGTRWFDMVIDRAACRLDDYSGDYPALAALDYVYSLLSELIELNYVCFEQVIQCYTDTLEKLFSALWNTGRTNMNASRVTYLFSKGILDHMDTLDI